MRHLLSYAFRPFFLLNGLFAAVSIGIWVFALHGAGPSTLPKSASIWHAHEMLVGFAFAAIAGFVLTAVATWTGRPPIKDTPLALLLLAWLAGRIAMMLAGVLPAIWVGALDMIFPALLVVFVAREVLKGGSRRNYPIVLIVGLLAGLNCLFHVSQAQPDYLSPNAARIALFLTIHLIALLITVVGGRIIPTFSANWLRLNKQAKAPVNGKYTDGASMALTICTGLAVTFDPLGPATGYLALAASGAHAFRLRRWQGLATRPEPLLFVLHVAYAWLPLSYLLLACSAFGWGISATAASHALTMGAIGMMVMAVTTRVALGHTGRKLQASPLTVCAYWVLMLAVVVRVLSPFAPDYLLAIDLAGLLWMLAFSLVTWVYWPILTGPRVVDSSVP